MASTLKTFYDRVMESSTTTGTGTYTLAGAVSGFQSFSVVGNGNTVYYVAEDIDANSTPLGGWEVGLGTYTSSGGTLSRDTILASSNSGSAVSWNVGTRRVYLASAASFINGLQNLSIVFSGTSPNRTASLQFVDGANTITVPLVTY